MLAKNTMIVMSSIIVCRMTGFLRVILIPHKFGVNRISDAYNIAFLVPDLFYNLLVGGAISAALIPILTGYIEKKNEGEGWKVISAFINTSFLAVLLTCILGMIFSTDLVKLVASGFLKTSPQDIALTSNLTRILFPSVIFFTFAGIANGVLNSYHRFAVASYGPAIYNLFCAASIFIFGSNSEAAVEKVAYGVLFSSIIYCLFQVTFAIKHVKSYKLKLNLKDPGLINLYKLAFPSLIASALVQLNLIISTRFITYFSAGNVTAFNMANTVLQFPDGIFIMGMSIAILPTLSAKFATRQIDECRALLVKSLKIVLLLTVPSMVGLIVLNQPILRAIYRWSSDFNESSLPIAGGILIFLSFSLLTQSVVGIITRGFYADNDTKTPLYQGIICLIANFALGYFLKSSFLGVAGIGLAYSLASLLRAGLSLEAFRKRINGLGLKSLTMFVMKIIAASSVMGVAIYYVNQTFLGHPGSKITEVLSLGAQLIIGLCIYFGGVFALNKGKLIE